MFSRSLLNKPASRHPLIAKHGTRQQPKLPRMEAKEPEADRVIKSKMSLSTLSEGVSPSRPSTPLSQKSLRHIPSFDSNLSSLSSTKGNQSPTPSLREKERSGLIERAEYYAMLPFLRAGAALRRAVKQSPDKLLEFHEELLELHEAAQGEKPSRMKKYETMAALDHLKSQGIEPPPIPGNTFYRHPAQGRSNSSIGAESMTGRMANVGLNPEAGASRTSLGKRPAETSGLGLPSLKRVQTGASQSESMASSQKAEGSHNTVKVPQKNTFISMLFNEHRDFMVEFAATGDKKASEISKAVNNRLPPGAAKSTRTDIHALKKFVPSLQIKDGSTAGTLKNFANRWKGSSSSSGQGTS